MASATRCVLMSSPPHDRVRVALLDDGEFAVGSDEAGGAAGFLHRVEEFVVGDLFDARARGLGGEAVEGGGVGLDVGDDDLGRFGSGRRRGA